MVRETQRFSGENISWGINGHAPPGYHTPEQVSNPEPLDSVFQPQILQINHKFKNTVRMIPAVARAPSTATTNLRKDVPAFFASGQQHLDEIMCAADPVEDNIRVRMHLSLRFASENIPCVFSFRTPVQTRDSVP